MRALPLRRPSKGSRSGKTTPDQRRNSAIAVRQPRSGVNLEDNVNTVSWVTPPAGTEWLAQANWMATANGEILGFDIRVSHNYNWYKVTASGHYDRALVVAHEVGHGIGLAHGPSSSDVMHALIQQGGTKDLGVGDRLGAAFLYPPSGPPQITSPADGSVLPCGSATLAWSGPRAGSYAVWAGSTFGGTQ